MTATDADIARRAGARCAAAEPHRHPGEDWPCNRCVMAAQVHLTIESQLPAPASAPATRGSAAAGAGADGGSGLPIPQPGQAGTSTQTDNRPGLLNPRAAYRPNDLGQNGR